MLCFCFDLFVLSMCIRCGWYTTRWAREFLLLYFSHSKIANSCVNSCCEAHVYVQNMYIFMCGWCVIRAHTYFHLPWLLATETISCVFLPIFLSLTCAHFSFIFFHLKFTLSSYQIALTCFRFSSRKHIYTRKHGNVLRCAVLIYFNYMYLYT